MRLIHELPARGDTVYVNGQRGMQPHVVRTVDLCGNPIVGDERHDDAATYKIRRALLGKRAAALIEQELQDMIDMGGVGETVPFRT